MSNPTLTKTFKCTSAIAGRTLVTFGASDGEVVACSAVTDPIIGVTEQIGSQDNGRVDVIVAGIAEVNSGGNLTRGDVITATATGQAATASAGNRIAGIVMQSAVANDIVDLLIAQG